MAKPVGNHQTGSLRGSLDECELRAGRPVWDDGWVTSSGTSHAQSSLGQRTPLAERSPQELAEFLVYRPEPTTRAYRILRTDRGFRVTGTPPEGDELEQALKAAGARTGSEVEVGDETMIWK